MTYIPEEDIEQYANLIIHLVAVDKDDLVLIKADFDHKPLIVQLVKRAYQKGAKYVHVLVASEQMHSLRAQFSQEQHLSYVPQNIIDMYKEYNDNRACVISLRSPEEQDIIERAPAANLATILSTERKALQFFYASQVSNRFSWIVCSYPTPAWAKMMFPKLDEATAVSELWQSLKTILHLHTADPIGTWTEHQKCIMKRRTYMNKKAYKKLRFQSSNTDLTVWLHARSTWLGATHTSEHGKYFQPNVPTEEMFTSPDCRYTNGTVEVQRSLPIFGKMVSGITMTFQDGKVVQAHARENNEILQEFLSADERNRYLGEIALVDISSPVWQSRLLFHNILYDENAGVHFALGTAYTSGYGYQADDHISQQELLAQGCNVSHFHLDFVIGSEDMEVRATLADGTEEVIMSQGQYINDLRS